LAIQRREIQLHTALSIALACAAAFWVVQSIRASIGMSRVPRLERIAPCAPDHAPRISVIFAGRDEAEKLPAALATMLALDYPNYEVIAVDDRSTDATPQILDDLARRDSRLRVLHITSLPPGWLGKTHALNAGYQLATGSVFVFTDADVHFAPDVLSRAITLLEDQRLDHISLLANAQMVGFWETVAMTFFFLGFSIWVEAWRISDHRSSAYAGIGAFQMIRRGTYESVGGHRRLALQVVEDMQLGKIVKRGGFRSQVALAVHHVSVRWHAGIGNLIRGTTKSFFAAASFRLSLACTQLFGILLVMVLPWVALAGLLFARSFGLDFVLAVIGVAFPLGLHAIFAYGAGKSPLYGFTHPIGALIFAWMLTRSTTITLWRGGVVWRDTFYPLADLRREVI
jgi:cellulose synthase/poly-beta-1,6-N-acetylglucosamine synthase-like glycosyltransferase